MWSARPACRSPSTPPTPRAFFRPLDRFNERWDELHAVPDWLFYGSEFPAFDTLLDSLYHLIESHPKNQLRQPPT